MRDERFEWHPPKARTNIRDHGVTFEEATKVFDDLQAVDDIDTSLDYDEERSIPEGLARDSLPAEYRVALKDVAVNGFTQIFALPDRGSGLNKWAVAQVLVSKPEGAFTLEEYQENIRKQLREEKSIRRTLDNLRREIYVSLRI